MCLSVIHRPPILKRSCHWMPQFQHATVISKVSVAFLSVNVTVQCTCCRQFCRWILGFEWWRVSSFFTTGDWYWFYDFPPRAILHGTACCCCWNFLKVYCVCVQDTGVLTPSLEISSKLSQSTTDLFEVENCLLKDCLKYRRKTRGLLFFWIRCIMNSFGCDSY